MTFVRNNCTLLHKNHPCKVFLAWLQGCKKFMRNSAEHEIFPAYKCWHFNIYERENNILGLYEPKKAEFLDILYNYEQLKFHAKLS